jgi:hypothetical protein
MGGLQELLRYRLQQFAFDGQGRLAGGQPGAVGDAKDVRVDGDRGFAESGVENHVGRLATDPRQRFERCARVRDFAAVLFEQLPAGGDDVPGLALVRPMRLM